MNKQEYLLVKLMEECAEVSKVCAKILRFGIDNGKPDSLVTNREELHRELVDIVAIVAILEEEGITTVGTLSEEQMLAPINRIYHYMNLSKELGTLTDETSIYS